MIVDFDTSSIVFYTNILTRKGDFFSSFLTHEFIKYSINANQLVVKFVCRYSNFFTYMNLRKNKDFF